MLSHSLPSWRVPMVGPLAVSQAAGVSPTARTRKPDPALDLGAL